MPQKLAMLQLQKEPKRTNGHFGKALLASAVCSDLLCTRGCRCHNGREWRGFHELEAGKSFRSKSSKRKSLRKKSLPLGMMEAWTLERSRIGGHGWLVPQWADLGWRGIGQSSLRRQLRQKQNMKNCWEGSWWFATPTICRRRLVGKWVFQWYNWSSFQLVQQSKGLQSEFPWLRDKWRQWEAKRSQFQLQIHWSKSAFLCLYIQL